MFRFTPRDLIRDLKHLLNDRYRHDDSGVAVIKELLQNADDARAKTLFLAWFEGVAVDNDVNPLLGRPGILVVNDAPFEQVHERAFTSFSTSSKDSDVAQIGRFGIGRKSLYHWTEVIFYLGRDEAGKELSGLLDPWAESMPNGTWRDPRYPDWIRWSSEDVDALRSRATALFGDRQDQGWFAVWLPARNERQDQRLIMQTITTAKTLPTTPERLEQLAGIMPQLAHLDALEIVRLDSRGSSTLASITRVGQPLGRPTRHTPRYLRDGHIEIRTSDREWRLTYWLAEEHRDTPELRRLKLHQAWPEEPPEDLGDPNGKPMPAKAEPHGAVTVISGASPNGGSGQIQITPAIFLPLSGPRLVTSKPLAVAERWSVLLHGYQFPDSGRQDVEGLSSTGEAEDDSTTSVRRAWNRTLREQVTLGLLPDALEKALKSAGADVARAILDALADTSLLQRELEWVTRTHQLVFGPAHATPFLVSADRRCLMLPSSTHPEVSQVLASAAGELGHTFAMGWHECPGIVSHNGRSAWRRNDVALFEEQLGPSLDGSPMSWLPWLAQWFETRAFEGASRPCAELALRAYRAALRSERWQEALAMKPWSTLCRIAVEGEVPLLWALPTTIEAYRKLSEGSAGPLFDRWDVLILDVNLRTSEAEAPPRLDPDLAVVALEAAAAAIGESPEPELTRLIALVLGATSLKECLERPGVRSLRILEAWSSKGKARSGLVSLEALVRQSQRRLVFQHRGMLQPESVAKSLSDSLAGGPEVLLVREDAIAAALELPLLGHDAIAKALAENQIGKDENGRSMLLDRLLSPRSGQVVDPGDASPELVFAMRRLIAGQGVPAEAQHVIYRVPKAMPRHVVEALFPVPWQVVPETLETLLARKVTDDWLTKLGIQTVDIEAIAKVLQQADDGQRLDEVYQRLGDDGRRDLGPLLTKHAIWGRLEIHRTTRGLWASLAHTETYLDAGYAVPEGFEPEVVLIDVPDDGSYADALRKRLKPWTPEAIIRFGAQETSWKVIADGLALLGEENPSHDLSNHLRQRAWIPAGLDRLLAPQQVLVLPPELDALTRALPVAPTGVVLAAKVASDVRRHAAWVKIEALFPRAEHAVAALLDDLSTNEEACAELRFQDESGSSSIPWVTDVLRADPAAAWWSHLSTAYGTLASSHKKVTHGLCSRARAKALLTLASRAGSDGLVPTQGIAWLRYLLMQLLAEGLVPCEELVGLRLPDAGRRLQDAALLSRGTSALPSEHRVHVDLEDLFEVPPVPEEQSGEASTRTTLEAWLMPWDDSRTSRSLLGYFVALFAANPDNGLEPLLRRLLPNDSAENILRNLTAACRGIDGGEVVRAARTRFRFVEIRPDRRYQVLSLTSEIFETTFATHYDSLLVDPQELPRMAGREGEAARVIRLRSLDSGLEAADRHRLLAKSIEQLVASILGRQPKSIEFRHLLDRQAHEAQQLAVAQNILIDSLPTALRQLRVHKRHEDLKERLNALERARHRLESQRAQLSGSTFASHDLRGSMDALDDARRGLRKLVEQDPDLERAILDALEVELQKFQYSIDQVLFELAQNADDAYAQRREAADPPANRDFEVVVSTRGSGAVIAVRHHGRPINHCYSDVDRVRGWDRDLINMLGVGFSEKGDQETGRFGLGFKSVYLIADRPRIRSENAAFEIRCGVLPVAADLRPDEAPGGTSFELPLRGGIGWEQVLARFTGLSGLLPVLSQDIERVVIKTPVGSHEYASDVMLLAEDADEKIEVVVMHVSPPGPALKGLANAPGTAGRWLFMRRTSPGEDATPTGPRRTLGLRLGEAGFIPVGGMPTLWVTVPTREDRHLGFIMSGPFGIDVGRSRLADESSSSTSVLEDLARLGRRGLQVIDEQLLADADALTGLFGEGARADDVAFSLLDTLTVSLEEKSREWEHDRVRSLLGPPMLDQVPLVSDVGGRRRRASELGAVLDAELEKPEVWRLIAEEFPVHEVAVSRETAEMLELLGYSPRLARKTVLGQVETVFPKGSRLTGGGAGKLLGLSEIQKLLEDETWKRLQSHVEHLSVSHAGNGVAVVKDIIIDDRFEHDRAEELLLAAFVPPDRILGEESQDLARCVARFRRRFQVSGDVVLGWAKTAQSDEARDGVIRYMFDGEQKDDLLLEIRAELPAWLTLERVREVAEDDDRPPQDADGLAVRLFGLAQVSPPAWGQIQLPPIAPAPQLTLGAIVDWWSEEADVEERRYHSWVYPAPWNDQAHFGQKLRSGDPLAWGTLFALTVCQRLGRVTHQQNRDFIAGHGSWVDVMATRHSSPEDWIRLIDDWGEAHWSAETYSHWLGLFPSFRRLWHRMDELIGLLRTAPPPTLAPTAVLDFPSNSTLSGTALQIPSFVRGFGAKGRVWLLRELVRLGVWPHDPSQKYYVPWRLACQLARSQESPEALGARLEQQLGPAPFGRCFDLPFDILRFDKKTRESLSILPADVRAPDDWAMDDIEYE